MRRYQTCFAMACMLSALPCLKGEIPVFGPEQYVRTTTARAVKTSSFSVTDTAGPFTLVVQSGEGKRGRLSSAIITLNGKVVLAQSELNKQVDAVTKPVTLKLQNQLVIDLRSEPGARLELTITGPGTPATPISGVTVTPDGFAVNQPTQVTFTAAIPYTPGSIPPTVSLERLNDSGGVIGVEGTMVDNGQLSQGDEIQGDGVFTFRKIYTISQPEKIRLRVKGNAGTQLLLSESFIVSVYTPTTDTEVQQMTAAQKNASQMYNQLLATKTKEQALSEVVAYLKGFSFIKDAGTSDGHIWIEYTNGIQGGISTNTSGRGGADVPSGDGTPNEIQSKLSSTSTPPSSSLFAQSGNVEVQSKRVLILSPMLHEFGAADEGTEVKAIYEGQTCPKYEVVYLSDANAGVGAFKALGEYGIVHVATHGAINNGRVVVATGTLADAANVQKYDLDLKATPPRLIQQTFKGTTYLAATPAFFKWYMNSAPSSLVFVAACETTANETLWNALSARNVKTFFGFTGTVDSQGDAFAKAKATYFHKNWIEDSATLLTTGEVYNGGCDLGGACWMMRGIGNLEAPSGQDLQDGGFETAGSWQSAGDGRIVSQLGTFGPTEGSRMGLISTGLGFTVSSGSVSQKVCIPKDAKTLTFDWNYSSEEFREYCGSAFQDNFRVDFVTETGQTLTLFNRKVDDLCAATFQVPFSFDRGDVWSTGWLSQTLDLSAYSQLFSGSTAVTLRFSAGDVGDSIYDTAVLLDKIKINK